MPIRVQYFQKGMTKDEYQLLRDALGWAKDQPGGSLVHTVAFREGGVDTVDLWESRETFEAYASGRFAEAAKKLSIQVDAPVIVDLDDLAAGPNIRNYVIQP